MFCVFHSKRIAIEKCQRCKRPVCGECQTIVKGRPFCPSCSHLPIPGVRYTPPRNPDRAAFLSLIVPGSGQVYNGQNIKGYIILMTFWLIVPWVYGIYDAYHVAQAINQRKRVTNPSIEFLVLFFICAFIYLAASYRILKNYLETDFEARAARQILQKISGAAEHYARDRGEYPAVFSQLYFTEPPYIHEPYCDVESGAYVYKCIFSPDGYEITATAKVAGDDSRAIMVTTGGVFNTDFQ